MNVESLALMGEIEKVKEATAKKLAKIRAKICKVEGWNSEPIVVSNQFRDRKPGERIRYHLLWVIKHGAGKWDKHVRVNTNATTANKLVKAGFHYAADW